MYSGEIISCIEKLNKVVFQVSHITLELLKGDPIENSPRGNMPKFKGRLGSKGNNVF